MRRDQSVGLASEAHQLYNLDPDAVKSSERFRTWTGSAPSRVSLLASIPPPLSPSYRPLHLLYLLLAELPGQDSWPTVDLIKHHARILKYLPEKPSSSSKSGARQDDDQAWLVEATQDLVKRSYQSFRQFILPLDNNKPALRSTGPDNFITHTGLYNFVHDFALPLEHRSAEERKPIVSIALPNGPMLAAVCVAVTSYYIAAPVNPAAGPEQFKSDVLQGGARCIVTTAVEYEKLCLSDSWVTENGIQVVLVDWTRGDDISLRGVQGRPLEGAVKPTTNKADDISLILFTSGTSGTKKVVPLTTHSLVAGIAFVIDSWGLTSDDTCLNMMPLYHVGGLVRNIFAPIFSGGATICCAAFEPSLFWDVVETVGPTWYYASPSMHTVILAGAREEALRVSKIRLVCNAAGGLLPSLACQLRDTFNSVVLPSYGMTECMPISTPPLDYKLDRPGTSGLSTGPEMTVLDWSDDKVAPGTVGRVCVRSEPLFPGYLKPDGSVDKSPFNKQGWFDTGDLGYLDEDGYLYITGRSKEVINRGGELISPFEVENAIMAAANAPDTPISGRVTQALCFSVTHDVLQEVVAIVLVTPPHQHRVDLKALHAALRSSLQQVKWPFLVTYMDDLPKNNNKVLRIKLGERLGIPEVTNDTPYLERHWEARCPPPDTPLSVNIASNQCFLDQKAIKRALRSVVPSGFHGHLRLQSSDGSLELFIAPKHPGTQGLESDWAGHAKRLLAQQMHNYMVPSKVLLMTQPFPMDAGGMVDEDLLQQDLEDMQKESTGGSVDGRVTKVFASVLSCDIGDVEPTTDFFTLGGDSLRAGQLLSALRSEFGVQPPISLIFNQGTVKAMTAKIEEMLKVAAAQGGQDDAIPTCGVARSSANPLLMMLQLFPLAVFYPMRRGLQWTGFLVAFSFTNEWPTNNSVPGRLFNLVVSIMFGRVCVRAVAPFLGLAAKWLIIGRYKEGLYPMWGTYHTRWWLVQKILSLCGKGFFGMNDATNNLYYRLMGARIGKNVKLGGAQLGEYDLLDIRDGVVLSKCTVRPFAPEGNTSMYLGRITVGENASVGLASIIAPGSVVPAHTCLGPNTSSWEMQDADESFRESMASRAPKPHFLLTVLFTYPLLLVGWFLALTPWLGGLVGMVVNKPLEGGSPVRAIITWFTEPHRIGFHYLALVLRTLFSPFILFAFAWLVKAFLDLLFGKLQPGPVDGRGTIENWRAHLVKTLLPVSRLHDLTGMFGQHYEATSVAIRMMGGNIGKRVYWPGTGPGIGDYHLLNVGNDVVFGSRAHVVTSDGTGAEPVTVRDGAMIADRVILLPGTDIGEKTTMGSGALTRRGQHYEPGGTYVGSKGGDAVCLTTGRQTATEKETDKDDGMKMRPRSHVQHMRSDETLSDLHDVPLQGGDTEKQRKQQHGSQQERKRSGDTLHGSEPQQPEEAQPTAQTFSPFGRAFYLKLAPFHVLGPFAIFCYSTFITVFTAFFWNVPNIAAIQIVDRFYSDRLAHLDSTYDVLVVYGLMTACIAVLTTAHAVAALGIVIGAKWALLGRRRPGNYDWDKLPYCQRWQLFLNIEKLRRQCYRGEGILGLLTGTQWIVWYFRALGASIGRDCALFANGRPSLMFTEPDLITMGGRVAVDDASVVAHINTRGRFDLNRLEVGDGCVLRTGSRLLSGAKMESKACLLEHTLVMGGDVVEEGSTMQGWPAERFAGKGKRVGLGLDGRPGTSGSADVRSLRSSDADTLAGQDDGVYERR